MTDTLDLSSLDLGEPIPVADTLVIHPADAGHAANISGIDWAAAAFGWEKVDHGIDEADLYRQCLAFVRLALKPLGDNVPGYPIPKSHHWDALRAAGDALLPRLAKVTGENI